MGFPLGYQLRVEQMRVAGRGNSDLAEVIAATCAPESAWCNTELMKFILYLLAPFYKLRAKVLELRLLSLFGTPTDQSESAHKRRIILCHRLVRQNKRFTLAPPYCS